MLQAERSITSNDTRSDTNINSRSDNWIRLGKTLDNNTRLDILELLLEAPIPEEFYWKADFKYLYYKDSKLVALIAYKLGKCPIIVHVIGQSEFSKSIKGYKFITDTFKDLKEYKNIVANIPNDREYMINFATRIGFKVYSELEDSKWYNLELNDLR